MFYIGVDLGQKQDHTAIAIVERHDGFLNRTLPFQLLVRRVQRVVLGTPYPKVVEMIQDITREQALRGQCVVIVDGTGVGAPVVDMLRAAGLGCEITAVTITSGEKESGRGLNFGVPRKDLIAGVQLALEKGELRIARRMKEVGTLMNELMGLRGEHDDLLIALSLACWRAKRRRNGFGDQRLPGF